MFSVDAPRQHGDSTDAVPDVVRIVASDDPSCVVDHPVLLAQRLPRGTSITGVFDTAVWKVAVQEPDRTVTIKTVDDRLIVRLQLQGDDPCTVTAETGSGLQVWGLGQCFSPPSARMDWIGRQRRAAQAGVRPDFQPYGHGLQTYEGGVEGYLQIPVLMVAGGSQPFAIVLDYVYRIEADFRTNPWRLDLGSDVPGEATFPVRIYVVGGATPLDVRRRVMDLLGRPPVPPRKAFGMWVSEFGFENWQDVDRVLGGLRQAAFPVDGVVLDLFWFGGIAQPGVDHSEMGRLGWDITDDPDADDPYFPDPRGALAGYAAGHVGFALIEESYVNTRTDTYAQIQADVANPFVRLGPSILRFYNKWFGQEAAMLDWSSAAAGSWIHENRRKPFMVDYGVHVHWTDLGEPEIFDPDGRYQGVDLDGNGSLRTDHAAVANLYNLLWHRSIDDGYAQLDPDRRRLLLSRAGTAGIQRYGSAIWSGDTGSRMEVLVSQLHNQAHMSCSGIDYYGSDVGGFRRDALRSPAYLDELYTQWFANSAWFDVPLRPHVDNQDFYTKRSQDTPDGPARNRVAPHEVGHRPSNLANLRTRYELLPYYYSLAHQAARTGAPIFPPPGIVYPDAELIGVAHQKLVGTDLLVAVVAGHGEYARRVYLPAGRWYDFYSRAAYSSAGEWVSFVPEYRDGVFRLPAFARAGAIIPLMHVDAGTLDSAGHRSGGGRFDDLVLRVFDGDGAGGSFTVYEDDGTSRSGPVREIVVTQQRDADEIIVVVGAAGSGSGLATVRPLRVELVSSTIVARVRADGDELPQLAVPSRTEPGWTVIDARTVHACLPDADVTQAHTFRFSISGPSPAVSSMLLVCDHAFTDWGEDVYARFVTPVQTASGPLAELKLDPSLAYPYMYPQPPAEHGNCPIWTTFLDHVTPGQEIRLTFEKRRDGNVVHANPSQRFRLAGSGGYLGEIRGALYN